MKKPDHNETLQSPSRRWFLRNTGAAAAGIAASTVMPAGAAGLLESLAPAGKAAAGLTVDGIRFEIAANALLEEMFLPGEQLSNMRMFFSANPTALDAYEFTRSFGSPHMMRTNMRNMLDFVRDGAHELDAAKALNPEGVSNFLSQLHRREIHEQFHHILPDSTDSELITQLRKMIGQDAHSFGEAQESIAAEIERTYAQLRQQFAAFQTELRAGEADYARDMTEQNRIYDDMPSARKAGGYPIPEHFKNRPESYVGMHGKSGEQRRYLGTVAPRRHIDSIIKS